jgi:type II secretory pathway component PulC
MINSYRTPEPSQFLALMIKRNFTTIILVLIIFSIITAAYLSVSAFYKMATAWPEYVRPSKAVSKEQASAKNGTPQPISHYDLTNARNLSNIKKRAETNSNGLDIENLKRKDLKLKLRGTTTGDDDTASAIIEETPEGKQNLVRVGDIIQSMTVKMILRGKVVLSKNGKDEILEMEALQSSRKPGRSSKETKRISKAAGMEFAQNTTLKRTKVEDAFNNLDEILETEELHGSIEPAGSLEEPGTEIQQNPTLKRIKVEDVFNREID